MLLEIENQLHRRVHGTLGQSAVVIRLAEEIDESGRVAEQAMIIVSFSSSSTNNPNKGAYIPTIRNRKLTYTITLIQKQTQREGHSFSLPILDLIADSVTGWVPEVPGLEFQTGFELENERFVQVTDASQFIYEQTYSVEVLVADGRFYSQPCAAFDPISIEDFLPKRKCLLDSNQRFTGLAVWRRVINTEYTEEYIVEDPRCPKAISDLLILECSKELDGSATYQFIPRIAYTSLNEIGIEEAVILLEDENYYITTENNSMILCNINTGAKIKIDATKTTSGTLSKVWKCYKKNTDPYPDWFKLKIDSGLWRNEAGTVPNSDPLTSALQEIPFGPTKKYNN